MSNVNKLSKMKKITGELFFAVLWKGLTQCLGWFFGLFGYKVREGIPVYRVGGEQDEASSSQSGIGVQYIHESREEVDRILLYIFPFIIAVMNAHADGQIRRYAVEYFRQYVAGIWKIVPFEDFAVLFP